ncbi:hypothetical protein TNCV_1666181 [Trichonephila clavipes]|nr:hypothetical protein TNCV_1666181 [Trichonephila clavipes]
MSHDYVACKRSLECPQQNSIPENGLKRSELRCLLLVSIRVPKLCAGIGVLSIGCRTTSSRGIKAVCNPGHDKTSPIFSVDQEPVLRKFAGVEVKVLMREAG